jgi:phosphatidylinositol 4-kinase type 2
VVDRHLQLDIVPRTQIVSLASPSFFYSYIDKTHARRHNGLLPPKIGSFQLFMHGFMDASKYVLYVCIVHQSYDIAHVLIVL